MKLDVLNKEGKSTGRSIELPDSIFGIEPNKHAVYLAVKSYNAAQRQGTHKAKERGEIKGSTKKIKKQKGTGTARAGSIKNPLFRTGGRIFGPRPRKYEVKLTKKVKRLARNSVLTSKATDGSLKVVEDFNYDAPKTKDYIAFLSSMDLANVKTTLISGEYNEKLYLSSRNLKKSKVIHINEINIFDLLNSEVVLFSESALDKLQPAK